PPLSKRMVALIVPIESTTEFPHIPMIMIQSTSTTDVRHVDRQLLDALRRQESMNVAELVEAMGVTATAVRQRIDRMLEMGLIQRAKISGGRGRPSYSYMLSSTGQREA